MELVSLFHGQNPVLGLSVCTKHRTMDNVQNSDNYTAMRRMVSSGILRRVALVRTNVSSQRESVASYS
jgi:hypothetical protein